ncbi:MAG: uracil-DNA glycosylase [Polaribacter sp.]|jgi:uracil-DNA glycosylase
MQELLKQIRACQECEKNLPYGANPVLSASKKSKILVIGQAPGRIVHNTGISWNDKSGKNLRNWLGVDDEVFYDTDIFGIVPMGFCYPGTGKSGDLPPRKECAPLWHEQLITKMPDIKLYLLIGAYAQKYYLGKKRKKNLTETVRNFEEYLPEFLPLPHPSPRNNIWQAKNKWFGEEVLPVLKERVRGLV